MMFEAFITITPEWTEGFTLGIVKVYLLLITSFSIWTPSLFDNSLPLSSLSEFILKKFNNVIFNTYIIKIKYQFIVGFGLPSITHSNLIDSSLFIDPMGSGNCRNTGAPIY